MFGLYGTLANPPALYPGDVSPNLAVNSAGDAQGAAGGLNTSGSRSERVQIARGSNDEGPPYCSIELVFSANPGAINFQIQEAHGTDTLGAYVTLATGGTLTSATLSADGTTYIATADFSPFAGSHVLIYCNTQSANAVSLKRATISR